MGNLTITPLNIGLFRFDLSDSYGLPPDHSYAGVIAQIPMYSYHIARSGKSILVDAMEYELEEVSRTLRIEGYSPPPSLLEQLINHGINPDDITDVVITHAHFDHYGALGKLVNDHYEPAFPRAKHYLGKGDWHPEEFRKLEQRSLQLVQEHGLLQLIDSVTAIGEGINIVPVPGETAGHQVLHVEHEGQEYYFAGDLYHHPIEFDDSACNVLWSTEDVMRESKARFMKQVAESGAFVYFTHITGAYRVIQQADSSLVWEQQGDYDNSALTD